MIKASACGWPHHLGFCGTVAFLADQSAFREGGARPATSLTAPPVVDTFVRPDCATAELNGCAAALLGARIRPKPPPRRAAAHADAAPAGPRLCSV